MLKKALTFAEFARQMSLDFYQEIEDDEILESLFDSCYDILTAIIKRLKERGE